jgi:acetolactate decarboxylase
MMNAIRVLVTVSIAGAAACSPSPQSVKPTNLVAPIGERREPSDAGVQVWGALRAVMHEGKTQGNVVLSNIVPGPHAYAVGALSGLRGEVTIVDDDVVISLGETDGAVRTLTELPREEAATLLVRSVVPRWTRHTVDHPIDANRVDDEVENIAKGAGLDLESGFAVLVEAKAKSLEWHVLGGQAAPGQNAHHGPRSVGKLSGVDVMLVGFYSRHDQGVFTHMGERTHFHVVPKGERMTGHVDSMALEPGAVIRLPDRP